MAKNANSWFQRNPPSLTSVAKAMEVKKLRRGTPVNHSIPIARDRLEKIRKILGV